MSRGLKTKMKNINNIRELYAGCQKTPLVSPLGWPWPSRPWTSFQCLAFSPTTISWASLQKSSLNTAYLKRTIFGVSKLFATIFTSLNVKQWKCPCRLFPWSTKGCPKDVWVEKLTLSYTSLKTLPKTIPWPQTLKNIDLSYNDKLESIEEFSIRSASGLENLGLLGSPPSIAFNSSKILLSTH